MSDKISMLLVLSLLRLFFPSLISVDLFWWWYICLLLFLLSHASLVLMESLDVRYSSTPSLPSDLLSPFLSFLFHLCSLTECLQYKDCTSCYAHSCTWCSQQDNCFEGVGAPCVANPDICCMYIFILSSSSPFNLYYNDHLLPSLPLFLSLSLANFMRAAHRPPY